jgi:hypothetical protein
MNYLIPNSYNLYINELLQDNDIEFILNNKIISFTNFNIFFNKDYIIYRINSKLKLQCLLDFLHTYNNIIIKKIYYYLIIIYLIKLKKKIYYSYHISFKKRYYDKYLNYGEYYLFNNDKIIITDNIDYNICLIIYNKTSKKSFIGIIDEFMNINCLYDIINENNFDDIKISIIGGYLNNNEVIIKIYIILKNLKLSKYIHMTYLNNIKPIQKIKYNSIKNSIKFVSNINKYLLR